MSKKQSIEEIVINGANQETLDRETQALPDDVKEETKEETRGRKPLYENVEDMQVIIDAYFAECTYTKDDVSVSRPTMSGLAFALDMSRQSLLNYSNKDLFLDTIKKARLKVEIALEQALYGNGVAGVIFNLKNNFKWVDKQEIDTTNKVEIIGVVEGWDDE